MLTNRKEFIKHLQAHKRIACTGAMTTKQILRCVRLESIDGTLAIQSTDLEIAAQTFVSCQGDIEACIPVVELLRAVKADKAEMVSIETTDKGASIDNRITLETEPADEFPFIPRLDYGYDYEYTKADIIDAVGKTLFSVAKDMSYCAYNGLCFMPNIESFSMVSTDGKRLTISGTGTVENAKTSGKRLVLPVKQMTALKPFFKLHKRENVYFEEYKNQGIFHTPSMKIMGRFLEGEYPKFQDVMPNNPEFINLDASDLDYALETACIDQKNLEVQSARFAYNGNGTLTISTDNSLTELDVFTSSGTVFETNLNPFYVREYAKAQGKETVSMRFKEKESAVVFDSNERNIHVLMPVT